MMNLNLTRVMGRTLVGAVAFAGAVVVMSVASAAGPDATGAKRDNYRRLQKPITIELTDQKLGDVVTFVRDLTGADIDAVWTDDRTEGLDREKRVTLSVRDQTALRLLEKVLDRAGEAAGDSTWQFGEDGSVQIGTKKSLNKQATLKLYPIHDLLFEIPDYRTVPELDLNSVLSQGGTAGGGGGGGGGGGSSLFGGGGGQQQNGEGGLGRDDAQQAQRLIDLIIETIEPIQWQDNGGDGGSIKFHNGSLLIKAPDYIHRQLVGYSFLR